MRSRPWLFLLIFGVISVFGLVLLVGWAALILYIDQTTHDQTHSAVILGFSFGWAIPVGVMVGSLYGAVEILKRI